MPGPSNKLHGSYTAVEEKSCENVYPAISSPSTLHTSEVSTVLRMPWTQPPIRRAIDSINIRFAIEYRQLGDRIGPALSPRNEKGGAVD